VKKIDKNNNRLELTANLQHLYHGLNYALHSCVNDLVLVTLGTLFCKLVVYTTFSLHFYVFFCFYVTKNKWTKSWNLCKVFAL